MLAVSGTVVNASVNLTRRVAATRESESDRAHVRFSDLLTCADLTDLRIGLTYIMHMDDNADAKRILLASPLADWRRQLGRPRITWLSSAPSNRI